MYKVISTFMNHYNEDQKEYNYGLILTACTFISGYQDGQTVKNYNLFLRDFYL